MRVRVFPVLACDKGRQVGYSERNQKGGFVKPAGAGLLPGVMLTDLYQLTMAQAYWSAGVTETEACFHLSFRSNPFGGGYALSSGLESAVDYLSDLRFTDEDAAYLAAQRGNDGSPLFRDEFLTWLGKFEFSCDVDGIPEGVVVFPREPLLRVAGPIVQCQVVETALLNLVNFQTLVATKAARVCHAADGDPVMEFGLRRAQGPNGGVYASRAAYVGGCSSTSNVLAGQLFGVPISGTHAHSWVMAFDSEIESFDAYAQAMPNNCTLLVDTYDTLQGVRNAVEIGRRLRDRGARLAGIRIDSGDLAWLSKKSREILDDGGFDDVLIIASNELDEHLIASLKDQGAAIDVWGVGTKLATAWNQPALGGVYKLSAIRRPGEDWISRIKVSEQTAKVTTPGILGVRRYRRHGRLAGDMIHDIRSALEEDVVMVDPEDTTRRKRFTAADPHEELLVPVFRAGERVWEAPELADIRERARGALAELDPSITRFLNPHSYPVGLEERLNEERMRLVLQARGAASFGGDPPASGVRPGDTGPSRSGGEAEE